MLGKVFYLGVCAAMLLTERGVAEMRMVTPEPSEGSLHNPGKGWVLYGTPAEHRNGSLAHGAVGYRRFNWCDIEPREGEYNWTAIDTFIDAWSGEGLQAAFGVMAANIHFKSKYVTPAWVFEAGCEPRNVQMNHPEGDFPDVAAFSQYEGAQVIPQDWGDPVFLEKLSAFLTAMAHRYDGNPNLAWFEIRSYGNWGEGHLWPWRGTELTPDQIFEKHLRLHQRIFKKTPLMAAETYFRTPENRLRAVKIGIGVRDDGVISFRNGDTTLEADGLAPSCFEWGGSYAQFSGQGVMAKLEDCVRNGHVYYCGFARGGRGENKAFAENEKELIQRLTNLMGYHLVIEQAALPTAIAANEEFPLNVTWRNEGVARMWFPCSVGLALLDDRGKVVSRTWLEGSDPGACPGGQKKDEVLKAKFDRVPSQANQLAFGLFRDRASSHPDVKLGLKNVTEKNWHPIAPISPR
jgi:hypothetical protein